MASQSGSIPDGKKNCIKSYVSSIRSSTLLWFALIAVLLVVSRVTLAPTYLVTFDEVNFALSIKKFDPVRHQPQPPGYPLYVILLRLLRVFVPHIEDLFLVAALLGSMLALLLLWAVGQRLTGERTGCVAALLLLFHPAFWFAALSNPIRIYLAAGAVGVAFCLVMALSSSRTVLWYSAAAVVFGIAGGFRPDLLFALFPLMAYTAWRLRLGVSALSIAVGAFLVSTSVWLGVLVATMGGPVAFAVLMGSYWHQQGATTSPLLGASFHSSMGMAYQAIIWTFAATLSWLWCAPFVFRRGKRIFTKLQTEFLFVWLVPGFLFYALVHIGDPDHPLSLIPVTCIAGAVLLIKFADWFAPKWFPAIAGAAVALNFLFFIVPLNQTAGAASYQAAASLDTYMQQVIELIDTLRDKGPVTAVSPAFVSGWRAVSYYFPDIPVLVIDYGDLRNPRGARWFRGERLPLPVIAGTILLPGCGTIAWIDPDARPIADSAGGQFVWMPGIPVTDTPATPNALYSLRGFKFLVDPQGCGQDPR